MGCGFGNCRVDALPVYILAAGFLILGALTVKKVLALCAG